MPCKDILIVDDDDSIRATLRLALEFEGYTIFEGSNGQQALSTLSQMNHTPCLIFLDLMMPIMDGWSFCAALKTQSHLAGIPVVVVTAFPEKAKTLKETSEVVAKPIDLDHLFQIANKYCGRGEKA